MKSPTTPRKTATRRTTVPRRQVGTFGGMLAKLGIASEQLKRARARR